MYNDNIIGLLPKRSYVMEMLAQQIAKSLVTSLADYAKLQMIGYSSSYNVIHIGSIRLWFCVASSLVAIFSK